MLNHAFSSEMEATTDFNLNRFQNRSWVFVAGKNMTAYKGSFATTLDRKFVNWLLHNRTARAYRDWLAENSSLPDESYWATLYFNHFATFIRNKQDGDFLTRFTLWNNHEWQCEGKVSNTFLCFL